MLRALYMYTNKSEVLSPAPRLISFFLYSGVMEADGDNGVYSGSCGVDLYCVLSRTRIGDACSLFLLRQYICIRDFNTLCVFSYDSF